MADVPRWFAEAMVALCECYPNATLREGMIRVYWAVLQPYQEAQVRAAFSRAPREFRVYFPSAGELLSLLDPAPDDKGLVAWNGLAQAASTVGAWQALEVEDAAVGAAVRLVFGGWPSFCEQCVDGPSGAWVAKRTEFLAAYRVARRSSPGGPPMRLAGLLEGSPAQEAWAGRLTAGGHVESMRERQLMAEGQPVNRLTEGE